MYRTFKKRLFSAEKMPERVSRQVNVNCHIGHKIRSGSVLLEARIGQGTIPRTWVTLYSRDIGDTILRVRGLPHSTMVCRTGTRLITASIFMTSSMNLPMSSSRVVHRNNCYIYHPPLLQSQYILPQESDLPKPSNPSSVCLSSCLPVVPQNGRGNIMS